VVKSPGSSTIELHPGGSLDADETD
jgi:hypothetical protein